MQSIDEEDDERQRKQLVKQFEELFSPDSLYLNRQLLAMIEEHEKGYVDYSFIFKQPSITAKLEELDLQTIDKSELIQFLVQAIKDYSELIWSNYKGIRLIRPYSTQQIVPLCFEGFETENHCQNFMSLLTERSRILSIRYLAEKEWVFVWAEQPEKLFELDGFQWFMKETERYTEMRIVRRQDYYRSEEMGLGFTSVEKDELSRVYETEIDRKHPCVLTAVEVQNEFVCLPVDFGHSERRYSKAGMENGVLWVEFPPGEDIQELVDHYSSYEQHSENNNPSEVSEQGLSHDEEESFS